MKSKVEQMWLAAHEIALDARKRGAVLEDTFELLRSSRALLNECSLDRQPPVELLLRADSMISEALKEIFSAASSIDRKVIEGWRKKIDRVSTGGVIGNFVVSQSKFYSGVGMDRNWVRVALPDSLGSKELKGIGDRTGVHLEVKERHVLIRGDKKAIRKTLDELAPYFKS